MGDMISGDKFEKKFQGKNLIACSLRQNYKSFQDWKIYEKREKSFLLTSAESAQNSFWKEKCYRKNMQTSKKIKQILS